MGDGVGSFTMQGLHHQQQQLAALLAAALPSDDPSSPSDDNSNRVSAVKSLHRAFIHPHNALLVVRSASFLCQTLSQLLSDKFYAVRQAAVIAYARVCAIVSCSLTSSSSLQSSAMAGGPADRFMGWALPQLEEVSADSTAVELALAGLHEFFSAGDTNGIEQYASPVIRACQELLENERASLTLLRSLLSLFTVLSVKFTRYFQSHFADIVDLLLGWALVPNLSETDRCLITDTFLQFQKLWAGNLQFSANLLSKFLGDMEVLAHDATPGTPQQLRRLLALVSCFVAVLQATATGMLEMNLLEHIIEPLQEMVPRLLTCLLMVAQKFGNARWLMESSRCLILLADILKERFANFYSAAMDVLLQCLGTKGAVVPGVYVLSSNQIQAVVKTNLQLMSSQRLALVPSAVHMILKMDSFFAHLRLHPNHLVTGLVAATYMFLLKHGSSEVVSQAIVHITTELEMLKRLLLGDAYSAGIGNLDILGVQQEHDERNYHQVSVCSLGGILSELEILALIRLYTGFVISLRFGKNTIIERLSKKVAVSSEFDGSSQILAQRRKEISMVVSKNINVYGLCIAKALNLSSSLSVKLEALDWINRFCEGFMTMNSDDDSFQCSCNQSEKDFQVCCLTGLSRNILFAILSAASDRELKVRLRVASVLELLIKSKLIRPLYFGAVADVALEKRWRP
ncbi:hypothetical protein KI387_028353 [Taxus chinensis]|uniref:Uncharacterized protein n=1 Tax=Taxus chinensis TaxID=29808 RepID=A0AA38G1A3_TAXCH|nr:hypothetical protein KI387_028353 [Taxus chinensis]